MEDKSISAIEKAKRRINSIKFEMSLWEKVELILDEDGTKRAINAEYIDDYYYPKIKVSGYNELNGCEETYTIPCWYMISDWSISDYKYAGETPAYDFPVGTRSVIKCQILNLRTDLFEWEERLKSEIAREKQNEEKADYYLLGKNLIGKRETYPKSGDFLFIDDEWTADDEKIVEKLLAGDDLTRYEFKSWPPAVAEMINSIKSIDKSEAMEIVLDQTLVSLKRLWKKKYALAFKEWNAAPKWWAKHVSMEIVMNGTHRSVYPKDLPFESPAIDGFMEFISNDLKDDFRARGAFVVAMHGDID